MTSFLRLRRCSYDCNVTKYRVPISLKRPNQFSDAFHWFPCDDPGIFHSSCEGRRHAVQALIDDCLCHIYGLHVPAVCRKRSISCVPYQYESGRSSSPHRSLQHLRSDRRQLYTGMSHRHTKRRHNSSSRNLGNRDCWNIL